MVKRKGGLGRGLGTLIPSEGDGGGGSREVDIDAIGPNPLQPRATVDDARLAELTASVREHGVLQPILVTRVEGEPVAYRIIAGERRWRAARGAGLTRVPVVVKEATPRKLLELALVENVQRADLSPLEEAAAYRQLVDEFGLTQEQIGARVGRGRVSVANTLRLLGLPEEVKAALGEGRITEGHARALLGLPDDDARLEGLALIERDGLNVRRTEELVRRMQEPPPPPVPRPEPPGRPADFDRLEDRFRRALGTRVNLQSGRKGGRIVIHFFSDEELDGIYRQIVGGDDE